MSPARPSAGHRRAARAQTARRALPASAGANTARSSATRRVPARSRAPQHHRRHAISCGPATPTVVRSSGLVPALPALHAARAQQSPDRRPIEASQPPFSAPDSSCHNAADSTPVLLPKSSLAQPTFVPSRKAESQLPLTGTSPLSRGLCLANIATVYRTGLCRLSNRSLLTEMEIGKTRAETGAQKAPAWHRFGAVSPPETPLSLSKPRKCREFSCARKRWRRDRTVWLAISDSNFDVQRENSSL
jgi:hypothetical protein